MLVSGYYMKSDHTQDRIFIYTLYRMVCFTKQNQYEFNTNIINFINIHVIKYFIKAVNIIFLKAM